MIDYCFIINRGLEYLHERCNLPVIHRDLKSSNILLDSNFNAKVRAFIHPRFRYAFVYLIAFEFIQISDFGLATTELHAKYKVKLSGASGYVAPEYLSDGIR